MSEFNGNPYLSPRPYPPAATELEGAEPALDQPWYGIGFLRAIDRFWRKALVFRGRASRGEFWWASLFQYLLTVAVDLAAWGADIMVWHAGDGDGPASTWSSVLLTLVLVLPGLSVSVRRLHDENLSGWWSLLPLAFMIGNLGSWGGSLFAGSAQSALAGVLTGLLLGLAYLMSSVVLFILPSNPAGARFDRPSIRARGESSGRDGASGRDDASDNVGDR